MNITKPYFLFLGALIYFPSSVFSAPQNATEAVKHYVIHCADRVSGDYAHLSLPREKVGAICGCMQKKLESAVGQSPDMNRETFGALFRATTRECIKQPTMSFEIKECIASIEQPTTKESMRRLNSQQKSDYCLCSFEHSWSMREKTSLSPEDFRDQLFSGLRNCEMKIVH